MPKLYSVVTRDGRIADDACLFYSNVEVNSAKQMREFSAKVEKFVGADAEVEWLDQRLSIEEINKRAIPPAIKNNLGALDDLLLSLRTGLAEEDVYDSWDEVRKYVTVNVEEIISYWEAQ